MVQRVVAVLIVVPVILAAVVSIYMILAYILSVVPVHQQTYQCSSSEPVYLSDNGVHVDIILHRTQLLPLLVQQVADNYEYVAFGWGDRRFYLETPQWDDLTVGTAANALLSNSPTAMHVSRYRTAQSLWIERVACPEQLRLINDYLLNSFSLDNSQKVIQIKAKGYHSNDSFYEATGSYNLIMTCNEWLNKCLKQAGLRSSVWSPFAFGIIFQSEKHNVN